MILLINLAIHFISNYSIIYYNYKNDLTTNEFKLNAFLFIFPEFLPKKIVRYLIFNVFSNDFIQKKLKISQVSFMKKPPELVNKKKIRTKIQRDKYL